MQDSDASFMNACVEFDIQSLMPTYKLMWGTPGDSQALAVARGLGFDSDIIDAAVKISETSIYLQDPGKSLCGCLILAIHGAFYFLGFRSMEQSSTSMSDWSELLLALS